MPALMTCRFSRPKLAPLCARTGQGEHIAGQKASEYAEPESNDDAEEVQDIDIDEEFIPMTNKRRRQVAITHLLDQTACAAHGVIYAFPFSSVLVNQFAIDDGRYNFSVTHFFAGLPIALGIRTLEVLLSEAPLTVSRGFFNYRSGSRPWCEVGIKVAASLVFAPVKVAAEIALARLWGAKWSGQPLSTFESFSATISSVQPWVLGWRLLYNIYLHHFKSVGDGSVAWLLGSSVHAFPRLASVTLPHSERRSIDESLSTIASRPALSTVLTVGVHCLPLLFDAPFFGSTQQSSTRSWLLRCAMRSLLLVAEPDFFVDINNLNFWNGLKTVAVSVPLGIGISVGWIFSVSCVISGASQAFRWSFGLEGVLEGDDNPTRRLLRKLRAVEQTPGGQVRGRCLFHLPSSSSSSSSSSFAPTTTTSSSSSPAADVTAGASGTTSGLSHDLSASDGVKQTLTAKPSIAERKQPALHTLPGKRLALLKRLRTHYDLNPPTAERQFVVGGQVVSDQAREAQSLPSTEEALAVSGTRGEAIAFHDPQACTRSDALVWVARLDLAPSLDRLALLPRHALVAQLPRFRFLPTSEFLFKIHFVNETASDVGGCFREFMDLVGAYLTGSRSLDSAQLSDSSRVLHTGHETSVERKGGRRPREWGVGDEVEVHFGWGVYEKAVVVNKHAPRELFGETSLDLKPLYGRDKAHATACEATPTFRVPLRDASLGTVRNCVSEYPMLFAPGADGGLLPLRLRNVPQPVTETTIFGATMKNAVTKAVGAWSEEDRRGRAVEEQRRALFSIGRLMALAIIRNTPLNVPFSECVFKVLAGEPFTATDLQRIDPEFLKHRIWPLLQEGGVETMEAITCDALRFVGVVNDVTAAAGAGGLSGQEEGEELVPHGRNLKVTEKNKRAYAQLLTEHYLVGHCRRELSDLALGFFDLIPKSVLRVGPAGPTRVSAADLELLVCGTRTLDVAEWRANTEGNLSGKQIARAREVASARGAERSAAQEKARMSLEHLVQMECWFWEIVEELGEPARVKLLPFACGTRRLPAHGFRALRPKFCVDVAMNEPETNLPSSHTCFNQLVLPGYQSKAQMKRQLECALSYGADGFGFI